LEVWTPAPSPRLRSPSGNGWGCRGDSVSRYLDLGRGRCPNSSAVADIYSVAKRQTRMGGGRSQGAKRPAIYNFLGRLRITAPTKVEVFKILAATFGPLKPTPAHPGYRLRRLWVTAYAGGFAARPRSGRKRKK
jgi:hypothetical protein